jgi:ribulose kinase
VQAGCQSFRAEVLNVMTGVFVNSAIKTRERDHETLIQNKQKFTDLVQKLLGHSPKATAVANGDA